MDDTGSPGSPGSPDWGSSSPVWDDPGVDELVTGEAVALELPAASAAIRALSGLVDVVLALVLLAVAGVLVGFLASDDALAAAYGVVVVALVLVIGPAVVETATGGRSIGKRLVGLRTVRDDAGPISFHHAFVRHLLSVLEIWVLAGFPALLAALGSRKGKRLGDMLAGTYVVRDRFALRLPPPVPMPPHLAHWAARADISPLPVALQLRLRQLLARGARLEPAARTRLLERTVADVRRHVAPGPPPGTPPEHFLAAVAAERRRRDQQRLAREAGLRQRLTAPR